MNDNKQLAYVDYRLSEWAAWARRGHLIGKGYPPTSVEWRILHEGVVSKTTSGPERIESNPAAEEMEILLTYLTKTDRKTVEVIRLHYLSPELITTKAKKLHMSKSTYHGYILMGQQWLAGRLSERYNF